MNYLIEQFTLELRAAGLTAQHINQIFVDNPRPPMPSAGWLKSNLT
jgi:predicted metal-dependent phosphotriesterase family hydrolase